VPGVVRRDVETVSVDEAVPLDVSATMLGANDAVGGTREMGDVAETDSLRLTLPENPLRLLRVMVEVPEDPMARLREFGEEVMLKSGSTNCHAVSACSSQCPSGSQ